MSPRECLPCAILRGERPVPGGVVLEDDHWFADHCLGPFGVGSFVVSTREHRGSLWEMTSSEAASLGPFLRRLSDAIVNALGAERVYLGMWVDLPPHHLHLVLEPRYPGRSEASGARGWELQEWRRRQGAPDWKAAEQAAIKVRTYLRNA
jgi:diadenosine tetraphosphate (Ap4A) HIT family hydrolase